MSLRILVMAHAYVPNHNAGAETTLAALCEHLVSRGHQVDVQLSRPTPLGDYQRNGVRIHTSTGNGDVLALINKGVDVILCHLENTTRAAVLGDSFKIPTVHLLHNTDAYNKHCIRRGRCDLAVYNTDWMQKDYETWFAANGMRPPYGVMMHPAIDPADYKTAKGSHDLVTLVNLWDGKGGDVFWDIAERMPGVKFLGVKGAYGVQETGDLPNVTVLPHLKPEAMAIQVYARTKILLMPSTYESYGRTAVEAASAGVPTIASPTPGLREALGNDGTFVSNRADPDEWVDKITTMLKPANYTKAKAGARAIANRQNPRSDLDMVCAAIEEAASGYFFALAGRAG